ncbi:hypothetical protein Tco_0213517 [Tanacetum coccineum]
MSSMVRRSLKKETSTLGEIVSLYINYEVTCENEAKRRNSGAKTKTFKENHFLLLYVVSSNEDTAHQRHLSTRNASPDTAYPLVGCGVSNLLLRTVWCMTRSSTKELLSPLENPERVLCSRRKLFDNPSLVELNPPEDDQLSKIEEHIEEEVTEIMAETMEQYISKTREDYGSGVTRPTINQETPFELRGKFLKELCDNAFSGSEQEDANEHIEKGAIPSKTAAVKTAIQEWRIPPEWLNGKIFSAASEWFTKECIGTISTWDDLVKIFVLKFHDLCEHEETDEDDDPNVIDNDPEIFKINDDLFKFDSPLCIAFEEFNYLLKIDPDLFTYESQKIKTYDEYEQELNNKTQGLEEPWSKNGVPYQLCDHVNTHDIAPFTRTEDFGQGPYANMKTKWTRDPYLGTNQISSINYGASNVVGTQENQGHKENINNTTPEQSVCEIRRFEMMKYSFTDDEEYITIKESEHLNHSKDSLDAYRELLRLTNKGWVVTTSEDR